MRDRPAERATECEVGVVAAVSVAGSEKAAAHRLGLSHSTVKHHLANAGSKLGAATTAQLVWILASRLPEPASMDGDVERAFSKDDLLTNVTIYWATETIGSSFRPYWDSRNNPNPRPWIPITVPCGIAVFPRDLEHPPREFAERSYNVPRWTEMPRGGHFAALEEPQLLAEDIRAFFRELRPR